MASRIEGETYYALHEASRMAGVSRSTLLRWLKSGIIEEPLRDRRGWRIFSEEEVRQITNESKRITRFQ